MSDEQTKIDEARAEAEEVKQEISEANAEAKEARAEGDLASAKQYEEKVDVLREELTAIRAELKKLSERPFAPAPVTRTAADEGGEQQTQPDPATGNRKTEETPEEPKEKVHRFGSSWFFGDRAYED